ncbi:MAG: trehalose-phosphatase [Chloroflexi bacterium]|nr:trehalose-phosphatase [Chloroflexota bacterium]
MEQAADLAVRAALEVLREPPVALLTDVDGTISPIADRPEAARVSPLCRRALAVLAGRLALVAVVSGRPAREAQQLLDLPGIAYVGNHGFEVWREGVLQILPEAVPFVPLLGQVLRDLPARLPGLLGVIFEEKGATASIHYRLAADPALARREILAALASLPSAGQLRWTEGRMVVELRPPLAVDKGTAVGALLRAQELRGAVYLGDDTTDVDAFKALRLWAAERSGRALNLAVLAVETPPEVVAQADYALPGVDAVERFLDRLAALA